MRWSCALLALACALLRSDAAVLRRRALSHDVALSLDTSGDWAASYYEAESEDRSFLMSQLDETEKELVELQQFLEAAGRSREVLSGLQVSAAPVDKKASAVETQKEKAPVASAVKKEVAQAADKKVGAPVAKKEAAKPTVQMAIDPAKLIASKLRGKAALAPMLAMLKGMYEESKERISQQNAREEKSKKWFAEKEAEHKAKLDKIEGRFKNGTLSEEFRTNETRDETRYFTYWSRCRERQHRQFHTNLKIQHAMMMKTKKMIDMYEKTLSGKASDQEQAKRQLTQAAGGMPEIVFLQDVQRTVGSFCQESLAEVRKERAELQQSPQEGIAW